MPPLVSSQGIKHYQNPNKSEKADHPCAEHSSSSHPHNGPVTGELKPKHPVGGQKDPDSLRDEKNHLDVQEPEDLLPWPVVSNGSLRNKFSNYTLFVAS